MKTTSVQITIKRAGEIFVVLVLEGDKLGWRELKGREYPYILSMDEIQEARALFGEEEHREREEAFHSKREMDARANAYFGRN